MNETKDMENEVKEEKKEELKVREAPLERPFITIEQMYSIARVFAERVFNIPDIAKRLRDSGMIINMKYYEDPDRWKGEEPEVTVDCTQDPIKLYTGPCEVKPVVIMRMHADTAHRFWMQKVNLMIAITKGEIKVKGPIPQVMRLLPIIKPSFKIYKEILQELGYIELLNYPADK